MAAREGDTLGLKRLARIAGFETTESLATVTVDDQSRIIGRVIA